MLKSKKADPITKGKLSYFKKLARSRAMQSPDNLKKAAQLSGFRSYHHLSSSIRKHFDMSVEDFLKGL